jgi:hypothetical protein
VPGGIHGEDVRDFWQNTLKANNWVMDVLKYGYSLPFHSTPEPSCDKNNASARKHMVFVREEVKKLKDSGVISFVDKRPTIVSPLTVASNSEGKLRLCLDVSRSINKFIHTPKVILADLKEAIQITELGDWQAVYDLASAYFHIKILESHTQFLGASFEDDSGNQQFFVYNFLAFGIASAVHVITKLMKPLVAYFSQLGIRHSIYLDDGRMVSTSLAQAKLDWVTVLKTLKKAGWIIAEAKSDSESSISQIKNYLGFTIDSVKMQVFLQPKKEKNYQTIGE